MLAAHYVSHRHPHGLRRLVLVSAVPSTGMPLWVESTHQLQVMKNGAERDNRKHGREGTTDDPEYQVGMNVFHAKHSFRSPGR